jgi:hypothetical protein
MFGPLSLFPKADMFVAAYNLLRGLWSISPIETYSRGEQLSRSALVNAPVAAGIWL